MANNSVKGIIVNIGGDTVDLQKSLKDVNGSASSIQKELNLINKSLKFDPENTVLLAQKQEVLSDKIAVTREKLERLQSVQSQVESQFKSGDLGAEKHRAFQREIEQTMSHLDYLQGEFSETENKANKVDLSQFQGELNDLKESAGNLKTTLGDTFADIGKGIVGAGAGVVGAVMTYDSVESAMNSLQAKTGLTDSKMQDLNSTLEAIYKNNFGESMTDVANVMAAVVQSTNETDTTKIQSMTENLFALRDVFDYDYAESLRSVNMLMSQFGISADEAFNLIVSGSQKGLNKNGDFLDTLNEYSVHYKQLGYDANEFLNSLLNGTEAGTFSVDKLGDAMKEFGIRTKDTATTTTEGFQLIGLDADVMRSKFAQGGEIAQQATQDTITALLGLDDEVKRNQAGVDLFGTMWEDLGIDGVKALMDVSGEAGNTVSSMEEIKDINYDDVKHDIGSIGRKFQTDIINPLIEKYYPDIEDAIEWTSEHLDDLIPILEGVAGAAASIWAGKKINDITSAISQTVTAYKSLKTATDGATLAQNALNMAQKSNVIGLAVGAIGTLISAGMTLATVFGDATEETNVLTEEQQKLIEKSDELEEEWAELKTKRDEALSETNSEFGYYTQLKEELDLCVDANGKIKTGYEERVDVIRNTLSEALGIDIQKTGDVLQNYKDISAEIDTIINKKNAESVLDVYKDSYQTALKEKDNTFGLMVNYESQMGDLQSDYDNAIENIRSLKIEAANAITAYGEGSREVADLNNEIAKAENNPIISQYEQLKGKYQSTKRTYDEYLAILQNYNNAQSAITSGNTSKINEAMVMLTYSFKTAEIANREALQKQYDDAVVEFNNLREAYQQGGKGVTAEAVMNAQQMVYLSQIELSKLPEEAKNTGDIVPINLGKGITDNSSSAINSASEVAASVEDELNSVEALSSGETIVGSAAQGIDNNKEAPRDAIDNALNDSTFWTNINNNIKKRAEEAGANFTNSLGVGVSSGWSGLFEHVQTVIEIGMLKATNGTLQINSPSKVGRNIGRNYIDSIGLGSDDEREKLKGKITNVSNILKTSFNDLQNKDFDFGVVARLNAKAYEIAHQPSSSALSKTITNAPVININFTGDMKLSNSSDIDELTEKIGREFAQQIQQEALRWG